MQIIEKLESSVRAYCRDFPTVFERARGALMYDREGREYVDFLAGAGALNYGHNDPEMKRRLIAYLEADGVVHSLDMATRAKEEFLEAFARLILAPRGLDHKVMFPGPTGTNAVESALKLARKVTGRATVVAFTGAFHGMTLGSLAATGNAMKRAGAGLPLANAVSLPYDGYLGPEIDTVGYLARLLDDRGSGLDVPAAVIVETVQGEGGLNAASDGWLCRLERLCRARGILLIVDDIQAGCGRTGTFFSFEPAGIVPDIVCLSKSIGGYGLPMALTLMRPSLDIWRPGEHNGTFRGNNLAFVAGTAALERWRDGAFANDIKLKAAKVGRALDGLARKHRALRAHVRGRGLLQGLACGAPGAAERIAAAAFARGLVIETSGPESEVVKVTPPLSIEDTVLSAGLDILAESAAAVARELAAETREVA